MANQEHWNVANEREMWLKVVGHEEEDRVETIAQAAKIFEGIPHGKNCLEIGAGCARFAPFATEHFRWYVGIDTSKSILNFALQRCEHLSVTFFLTDGTSFPIPDEATDFVFSFTCFQHMPTLEMVRANLKETYRVLRAGGLCRIQTVQGDYLESGRYDGVVFKTIHDFAEEFKAVGFKIEDAHLDGEWIWVTGRK